MRRGTKLVHYKGGKYTVIAIGICTNSENLEELIMYRNDADRRVWVRPIKEFYENVYYKDEWVPRFKVRKIDKKEAEKHV